MNRNSEEYICSDPKYTLKGWKNKIEQLIKDYGEDALMTTDAGHNNVDLIIVDKSAINKKRKSCG